jgi:hypothetical protein
VCTAKRIVSGIKPRGLYFVGFQRECRQGFPPVLRAVMATDDMPHARSASPAAACTQAKENVGLDVGPRPSDDTGSLLALPARRTPYI